MTKATQTEHWNGERVQQLLEEIYHELVSLDGLVATDRPDLPLKDDTSWKLDMTKLLKKCEEAMKSVEWG